MTALRRPLGVLSALAALLAAWPAVASAHAMLESTTPERGADLARAPGLVSMRFSESVDASLGAVEVFDGKGHEIQRGSAYHPAGRGDTVAVRLPASLPRGGYTATYRVISADSHPVSGGFSFNVGNGGAGAQSVDHLLAGTSAGAITSTAFGATRAVQFAAIALALGCVFFLLLCWLPALRTVAGGGDEWRRASDAFAARLRRLLIVAAGAGAVTAALGILLQGAVADGTPLWSSLHTTLIGDVLQTRFGVTWGLAILVWLGVLAVAVAPGMSLPGLRRASLGATGLALPRTRTGAGVPALVAAGGLLSFLPALGGHASVESPTWLMLPANVVHVLSIGAWMGGLAVLVLALRAGTSALEATDRTRLLAEAVGRFSTLGGIAVAVILATGIAQSLAAMDAWSEFLHTAYGRAVLIKIVLFAVMLGFGAYNRTRVLPALRAAAAAATAPGKAGRLLRRSLRLELPVGIVVLGVSGALSTYPPADAVAAGPASASAIVGPARLDATVDPATTGPNQVHLYLFDRTSGAQWTKAKQLTVTAALPARGIDDLPVDVSPAGPGHYTAPSALFSVKGQWTLTVTARVSDFDQYEGKVHVRIR